MLREVVTSEAQGRRWWMSMVPSLVVATVVVEEPWRARRSWSCAAVCCSGTGEGQGDDAATMRQ